MIAGCITIVVPNFDYW